VHGNYTFSDCILGLTPLLVVIGAVKLHTSVESALKSCTTTTASSRMEQNVTNFELEIRSAAPSGKQLTNITSPKGLQTTLNLDRTFITELL
jgi:hypothetical protein